MPTFDGGHCFLTALLPIKTSQVVDQAGLRSSPVHMVRDALSILPVARQSPVTEKSAANSPFAKSRKTHFARMAVIEDTIFNGRARTDAILDSSDRTVDQPIDELPCPYLMLVLDFDAPQGTEAELRDYLRDVWTTMGGDLAPVFENCFGYREKAVSADGFADYIIACQVETTMPFNDYWPGAPPLQRISIPQLIVGFVVPAAIVGGGLYAAVKALGWIAASPWFYVAEMLLIGVLALAAGLYTAYRIVMWHGARPFAMAPNSDLRSILKALYLQRELIAFAVAMQGRANPDLFDAFGAFLVKTNIDNPDSPTQLPGTIRP